MSAADGIAALRFWEQARRFVTRANVLVVGCATVVLIAYAAGREAGVARERGRMVRVLAESSKVIEARMKARAPTIVTTKAAADSARATHRAIAARIVPVTDSTVSIDGGPPVAEVPATLVIPAMHTCEVALVRDTVAYVAVAAQLEDMTKARDTWKERAELAEGSHPRLGFRSGLAAGAGFVGLLVWLVK